MSIRARFNKSLEGRPMTRRVGSAVGWSVAGNMCWRMMTMVSAVCIARLLTAEDFGAYGLILDTIATFSVLASFRLGSTATRYVAKFRSDDPQRAGRVIKLTNWMAACTSGLTGLLVIVAAPVLARTQLENAALTVPLMIAGCAMFFRLTGNVLEFTLAGFEDFKSIAGINFLRGLGTVAAVVPLAVMMGLKGVFLGLTAVAAAAMVIYFRRIAANMHRLSVPRCTRIRQAWAEHGIIWAFALPGVLAGLMEMGAIWQSKIMLNKFAGMDQVGVFNAANQWRALIMFLPGIIGRAVLPVLSETFGGEGGSFNKAIQVNLRFMWMLALPTTVLLIGFADLLAAVFGKKYEGCEQVIPWLMSAVFLYCVSMSARHVMDGAGKRWVVTAITFVAALVMLAATWLSLETLTISAPAIGQLAGYGVLLVGQLIYIELFIARGQVVRRLGLYAFSAAVLFGVCWARFNLPRADATLVCGILLVASLGPLAVLYRNIKKGKGISG